MKALARQFEWAAVPAHLHPFAKQGQTFITPGTSYVVAAVSVYSAVTFLLIVDDLGEPGFVPSWFFEVDAGPVPDGWRCAVGLGGAVDLVLGPEFVTRDLEAYTDVVDHVPSAMDAVVRFVEASKPRTD